MKKMILSLIATTFFSGLVQASPIKNILICVPESYRELPVGTSYQVRVAEVSGITTSYQLSVLTAPVVPNAKFTVRYNSGVRKTSKGMITRYTSLDKDASLSVSMKQNKTTGTMRGKIVSPVLETNVLCKMK